MPKFTRRQLSIMIELDVTGGQHMRHGTTNASLRERLAEPLLKAAVELAYSQLNLTSNEGSTCRVQFLYGPWYDTTVHLEDCEEDTEDDDGLAAG